MKATTPVIVPTALNMTKKVSEAPTHKLKPKPVENMILTSLNKILTQTLAKKIKIDDEGKTKIFEFTKFLFRGPWNL